MIRKLSADTFYIGADDKNLDLFESQYIVPDGISYNSYVVIDDKVAILDTIDERKADEWVQNLSEALGERVPDYLVVHHLEPDHSALIARVMEKFPSVTIVASARAIQMIPQFFEGIDLTGRTLTVKEGDVLDLGHHKLRFFGAPMVHWPEVMVSLDESEGVLYSADAFGKFGTLDKCGFYGRDDADWSSEARRYYFNIVGKYGGPVQTLLGKLKGQDIRSIRPLHGPILEDNLDEYLSLYDTWSKYEPETEGVFIAAASIHGGTLKAAEKLAEMLRGKGVGEVVVSDLCRSDIAENVEDAFRYSSMIVAASSYDGGLFTPMYDFLHRLQIKGYTKRNVGILENGSWAPCAGRIMKEMLSQMKEINKVAILDTIDERKADEWVQNLSEALGERVPDYLVVHHLEPDHSALIARVMEKFPSVTIVASARAIQMIPQFFEGIDLTGRTLTVKEGDVLDLGHHKLRFFGAPMVHWPEVMVSLDESEGVLYSADAFGKFGTLDKCGFYGRDDADWSSEARRYYFNIVGKYGGPVQTLLGKLKGQDIRSIRPLHGPILEDNLDEYLSLYDTWSKYEPETEGVFIAAASIHGGTLKAAEKLAEMLRGKGVGEVVVSDLCRSDIAENVEDAFRYSSMIVAASSYDGGLFTPMYDFLHRLQIKGYTKRNVGILENGSWAPCAGRIMKEMLSQMKEINIVEPMVTIRSRMKSSDLPAMETLATEIKLLNK